MVAIKDADITRVVALLKTHNLQEIEIKDGQKAIRVTAKFSETSPQAVSSIPASTEAPAATPVPSAATPGITAPIVGTVYLTPSPDEPAFVRQGQKIKKGQTVCLIEAMKTFNHIQSEIDAEIVEVCVKNGETVEYGQTLFILATQTA